MTDLGERLAVIFEDLDLPEADLVDPVLAELTADFDRNDHGRTAPRRFGLVTAAAVILFAVGLSLAIVVIEPARSAVADFLGIGATKIERGTELNLSESTPSSTTPSSTTRSTVAQYSDRTEITPLEPGRVNPIPSLGPPLVADGITGRRRTYYWDAGQQSGGSDISLEVRTVVGSLDMKQLGAEPEWEFLPMPIDGGDTAALWISGQHERTLDRGDTDGDDIGPTSVAAGPTLLWVSGEIQFRLEGQITKDEALSLAAEISGGTNLLATG